ncbi:hypothetical protein CSUI_007639 [Cystoisospora suis]|uniref:Uncharacterized protein n=1 Tax=Cystoisospora suis TaxID=483139 RepID=A0A2C6KPV8_9APIC|nr:hypothetical protein CSUI_007639 [Cystoisospora suis]
MKVSSLCLTAAVLAATLPARAFAIKAKASSPAAGAEAGAFPPAAMMQSGTRFAKNYSEVEIPNSSGKSVIIDLSSLPSQRSRRTAASLSHPPSDASHIRPEQ